ncbi:DUF1569 domain-containing protein [Algibacter lectus]|uniref:DUF1569 domain-containing protein n=1 Tax=Algibacter lectus TaxID=221126 RepID=A0A090VFG5_9FLAO|nr:DUF1569 domain-containing protein [Algibacter lectus]MDO7136959.1 DUF1569 domain-containing protein [Algibacter lectus]GAL62119.1 hypothetical protein JCM19300_2870 [Algibacter lectus]
MKNMFNSKDTQAVVERIKNLDNQAQPLWGKMSVDQMLAHCNVTYEMVYDNKHPKPNAFKRWMLKTIVKPIVVGDKPYKKNSRTAPEFVITDTKNFDLEKSRLVDFINRTQQLGANHFENKASHSFGNLNNKEWNTMFYKHLDHHLNQFGV